MGNAIARRENNSCLSDRSGQKYFSEREIRREFTALILPYTAHQLSEIAGVTPEGARHWIGKSRSPNLASAFNVARGIPAVAQWIAENIGHTREAKSMSRDAITRALYALAATDGTDALWARKMVALMSQPAREDEDEQPRKKAARDTQTIDFVEQLQQRRGHR